MLVGLAGHLVAHLQDSNLKNGGRNKNSEKLELCMGTGLAGVDGLLKGRGLIAAV